MFRAFFYALLTREKSLDILLCMNHIFILGNDTPETDALYKMILEVALARGFEGRIERAADPGLIDFYHVESLPAVIVDNQQVCAGALPDRATVRQWFDAPLSTGGCGSGMCCR